MGHKTQLYLNEPGRRRGGSRGRRRGPVCRGSRASGIRQKGAALNITALVFCPGRTPSCQQSREASVHFAGSAGVTPSPATRLRHASAKPTNLTLRRQSEVRGLRRDGCMGRARQNRTQPGGEVSDQIGFISEVGHFSERRNGAPA